MLTEHIEFLQDAWDTMLRCPKEYDIDLDRDDAFRALELTRNHALRVAEQAFSISDQFLFPQTVGNHYDADGQKRERRPKQAHSKTAEEGKNIGNSLETKGKAISNAIDCKQNVYAIIEAIIRETEDVDTLLLEKRDKHEQRESETGEESKYEDPEEIIVLDNLIAALGKSVGNSTRETETHSEKRTGNTTNREYFMKCILRFQL